MKSLEFDMLHRNIASLWEGVHSSQEGLTVTSLGVSLPEHEVTKAVAPRGGGAAERAGLKRLACHEVLDNLPFELDAVGAVVGHGFHPLKAR